MSSHGPAMAYMSHGRADAESLLEFMDSRRRPTSEILVIFLGQPTSAVTIGLHSYADTLDCIISSSFFPYPEARVRYDLESHSCTIRSCVLVGYDVISRLVLVRYQSRSHIYYDT